MKINLAILLTFFLSAHFATACFGFQENQPSKSLIADAMENRDWDAVLSALKNDEDVSSSQADGMTALHWAIYHGDSEKACALIERGADVAAKTLYGVTPLDLACEYGDAVTVKKMIAAHSDLDLEAKRLGGETPLMLAARNGDVQLVEALIQAGAELDTQEAKGQNALMWAAAAGNTQAVDRLLNAGADFKHATEIGFTPFLFAARQGKTECVMRLLAQGADISMVMKSKKGGRNPRTGTSALILAMESGHYELALKLVEQGADPNDQRSGFAPLHAISMVRKTERGESPSGDPPPRTTGSVNSLDFVREMVELGADINLKLTKKRKAGKAKLNPQGMTPLLYASRSADIELMKLMIELGADPKLTNVDGCNALMAAAGVGVTAVGEEPGTEREVEEAIKILFGLGVDINAVDKNGETAMHGAAYRSFPDTVKQLAELGADPKVWNKKNKLGWTPHAIASGKRPGSPKPSPPTAAALDRAME